MTFLVLNRRRILDRLPKWFPDAAEQLVVVTAPGPVPAAGEQLREKFRHLEIARDYESAATEDRIEVLCRRHRVTAILHTAEIDILRAARIGAKLGLPGQSVASATAYRDKDVMKQHAADAGLQVAAMRRVESVADLDEFAARHGFPVVLKRIDGAAAAGMGVAAGPAQLRDLTASWNGGHPPRPMLAESWIDGDLYHVDGVMHDGRVLFDWPSRYLYTNWRSRAESLSLLTGMLPAGDPLTPRLRDAARRVVEALPHSAVPLPFHAEFFHTPADEVVLCEVACRAGGALIVDAFEHGFGINLYEAGLKGQAGRFGEISWRAAPDRYGNGWFMRRRGRLLAIPESCPLPAACHYRPLAVPGAGYAEPSSIGDVVGEIVFRLDGPDVAAELAAVDRWWESGVRWESSDALV